MTFGKALFSPRVVICLLLISYESSAQPNPPSGFTVVPYERHIEVRWNKTTDPEVSTSRLYRENKNGSYELLKTLSPSDTLYLDWTDAPDISHRYTVTNRTALSEESDTAIGITGTTHTMSDEQFKDMVQQYTFRYFWEFAHPVSGLTRERNTSGQTVTMGGSGFGLMGILVGIERGFITYEQGLARILKIVLFLENADRFYGIFPHWMNGTNGDVIPFSSLDNGGDIVETAFLFEGLLTVREYFSSNSANEIVLRQKITNLWHEANWDWYRNNKGVILWHWSPQHNFAINHEIRGWNEALIVYLLGVASPTHPVPASVYHTGWAGGNYTNGFSIYGYTLDVGPLTGGPLFFAHYSFMGFDPRFYRDAYANYFIQNKHHTLINRAYCIDNPENHIGYSDVCWGLTASDDPLTGYLAHEATLARDNGTITPTAALSSMPYTPDESMEALKHFYRAHGERLWGPMGFYDAFNLTENWFATSYLAIDQGPILCMIENHRSGLLWDLFMQNPEIAPALDAIGFEPDSTSVGTHDFSVSSGSFDVYPNPVVDQLIIHNTSSLALEFSVTNLSGVVVGRTISLLPAGQDRIIFSGLPAGIYVLTASDAFGRTSTRKICKLP
jgi:hypothetical protein